MLNQVRPLHIRRGAPEQDSRIPLTVQLPQPLADPISVRLDPNRSPTRANSFHGPIIFTSRSSLNRRWGLRRRYVCSPTLRARPA